MLTSAEQQIADDLLAHTLDLFRLDASLRGNALSLLQKMQKELRAKLGANNLTAFGKDATQRLLAETSAVIDDYYRQIKRQSDEALNALPEIAAQAVRDALAGVGYATALAPPVHFATAMTDVMIQGAPSSEWWARQSTDTKFRFSNVLRQGIVQGKTNQQIIGNVLGRGPGQGVLEVSRRNAAALVQTSVQTVANVARLESFAQNADVVKGVKQISTLDSHTTDICIAYSGMAWNLEGKPIQGNKLAFNGGPPRHWNCRSLLVPMTKSFKELGIDIPEMKKSTRASSDGQISAGMTFDDFLTRKGKAFQDEILGPGRAQLWRDKKITLQQLLDLQGNPLSLSELQAKYKVAQVTPPPKVRTPKIKPLIKVGNVSPEFVQRCQIAYEKIPLGIRQLVSKKGGTITIADKLTNARPDLKGVQPRGYPSGATWDSSDGCATGLHIYAAETFLPLSDLSGGFRPTHRPEGIILHETGHVFDNAGGRFVKNLQLISGKEYLPLSRTKKFVSAYNKDIKDLTRRGLIGEVNSYYRQPGIAGPSEAFAETFAWLIGKGSGNENLADYFVELAGVIKDEMLRYQK